VFYLYNEHLPERLSGAIRLIHSSILYALNAIRYYQLLFAKYIFQGIIYDRCLW